MTTAPRGDGEDRWLLGAGERGNAATGLPAWSRGNAVSAVVDGADYFTRVQAALAGTGPGDVVMLVGWRTDADQVLGSGGPSVARSLLDCLARGAAVRGMVWRSHVSWLTGTLAQNRDLVTVVNRAGGELLLDHRVRRFGSHHQKFIVVRHATRPERDVAFVGGIDLARSRRDSGDHDGDPVGRPFAEVYGSRPAWHDAAVELRGPVVADVERAFLERWNDPQPLTRLPWHTLSDRLHGLPGSATRRAATPSTPRPAGSATVQLLRTYPRRWPGYPFAPQGERSIARGYTRALAQARRLVYVEDQYLWSGGVAGQFAEALRRNPDLHVITVAPPRPDTEGWLKLPQLYGRKEARDVIGEAGAGRIHRFDIATDRAPVYVHAKLCIIDDVWAAVGSSNLNRRSWTHDSELTAAVLDGARDEREPADPGGDGDGARRFARDLRLQLMREHLERNTGDDADLLDPARAVEAFRAAAARLDEWHASGRRGPRPPGRVRQHVTPPRSRWLAALSAPPYRLVYDPDGRPLRLKLRRTV